jgi:conjugative relaxase-like TrwC/TraI family protein
MLRVNAFNEGQGIKNYYENSLSSGDYYLQKDDQKNQEINGDWGGRLSEQLGLQGRVTREDFFKLLENINPKNNEQLTARTVKGRRVGYDFNFHVPKSFSVLEAITQDENLTNAFKESVRETMEYIEGQMETRVRKGNQSVDRLSQNMAWAEFVHLTARPIDGIPDPHLHAHCFAFNATYDPIEQRIKAGQFGNIKRNADLSEAVFHSLLMKKTRALGYPVKLTAKSWEIDGVPASVNKRFSRRTSQIEELAEKLGTTDPKYKERLGSTSRENKQKDLTMAELRGVWSMQLTGKEKEDLERIRLESLKAEPVKEDTKQTVKESVNLALDDTLERRSVATDKDLLKRSLILGKGSLDLPTIQAELDQREQNKELITSSDPFRKYYSTREVLGEEKSILSLINSGRSKYSSTQFNNQNLENEVYTNEQKEAVKQLLNSKDAVISLKGGAGTGKTTTTKLAVSYFNKAGKQVYLYAPTSQASRGVLRDDGFTEADTVAKYLKDQNLQKQSQNQIIWIDEAGLLSAPQLKEVLELARKNKARVVLAGDTRQHSSVERGDALRLAETKGRLPQAELKQIRRQTPENYRRAVELIQNGNTDQGFEIFDQMGAIQEIQDPNERHRNLAKEYTQTLQQNQTPLVISPTNQEGKAINRLIRDELQTSQRLGTENRPFEVLKPQNLTQAQKRPDLLEDGQIVRFHKNFEDIKAGQAYQVQTFKDIHGKPYQGLIPQPQNQEKLEGTNQTANPQLIKDKSKLGLASQTKPKPINLWQGAEKYFNTYEKETLPISTNEKIRITQNSKDQDGKELLNGQDLTVSGFTDNQQIQAKDKKGQTYTLPKGFQDFTHGYTSTSYGSQGKTADKVLISQPTSTFPATDRKQFYVSTSRGRNGIKIYTDDKEGLKEAVQPIRQRSHALDLTNQKPTKNKAKLTEPNQPQKPQKEAETRGKPDKNQKSNYTPDEAKPNQTPTKSKAQRWEEITGQKSLQPDFDLINQKKELEIEK